MGFSARSQSSEDNNIYSPVSVSVGGTSSVINKTIKSAAVYLIYSGHLKTVNINTDMARQRRERGSQKQNEANIPSPRPDLPPSYEDTIKNGQAGGFVVPTTTGGLPVKTIVQVVQVPM